MIEPSITVVTAVVGSHTDPLQAPLHIAPGVTYRCYTDQPPETIPSPWEPRSIINPPKHVQPVDIARWVKILIHHHVSTDVIVWQDAAYQLAVDPALFVSALWRADMLVLPHPARQTVEEEAAELVRLGLAGDNAVRQAAEYRAKGFQQTQLSSTGLLVRRNDAHVRAFNRAWWRQLTHWKHPRDQMSFDYCAWRAGVAVAYLTGHYRNNPYADWTHTRGPRRS